MRPTSTRLERAGAPPPAPLAGDRCPASPTTGSCRRCEHGAVPRSVLVVDDDASFRDLAARVLDGVGATW